MGRTQSRLLEVGALFTLGLQVECHPGNLQVTSGRSFASFLVLSEVLFSKENNIWWLARMFPQKVPLDSGKMGRSGRKEGEVRIKGVNGVGKAGGSQHTVGSAGSGAVAIFLPHLLSM